MNLAGASHRSIIDSLKLKQQECSIQNFVELKSVFSRENRSFWLLGIYNGIPNEYQIAKYLYESNNISLLYEVSEGMCVNSE